LNENEVQSADVRSLQLLLSDEAISIVGSQFLQSGFLRNENLKRQFLGCSKADIWVNLLDLESADVSVEALDSLLLSELISIDSEDAFLRFILKLGPGYWDLLRHIQLRFLSEDGLSLLEKNLGISPESVWQYAAEQFAHLPLDSRIISSFQETFAEFQRKRLEILWRGSRDGFKAEKCHRRCDGHASILTIVLDTERNIFGGCTPLTWESGEMHTKADDSLKSFLFTLTNPHSLPARRFTHKAEQKRRAIRYDSKDGPWFCGLRVLDNCNANTQSDTNLGGSYDRAIGGVFRSAGTESFDFSFLAALDFFITQTFLDFLSGLHLFTLLILFNLLSHLVLVFLIESQDTNHLSSRFSLQWISKRQTSCGSKQIEFRLKKLIPLVYHFEIYFTFIGEYS
jgi:hypothetical protein